MQTVKSSFKSSNEFNNFFSARRGRNISMRQVILSLKPCIDILTVKIDPDNTKFRVDVPYAEAKKRGLRLVTRRVRYTDGRPKALVIGAMKRKSK
jgi:hypothetical protein